MIVGLLLVFLSGGIPSFLVHIYVKNYPMAVLISGAICVIVFPVASWIEMGYLDPLWLFGLIPGFFWGCGISLFVGIPFWYVRKIKGKNLKTKDEQKQ